MFLALLVFSKQEVFLLLPIFFMSQNKKRIRTEAYLDTSKRSQGFNLHHPSLIVDPQCSLGVCQNSAEAAVLIALPGDRAGLLPQPSGRVGSGCTLHWSTQRKSPVQGGPVGWMQMSHLPPSERF